MSDHTPPARARSVWIDAIKGITIASVVLIHLRFFLAAYTGEAPSHAEVVLNACLKSFHLPALFFASGLLIRHSLRHGVGRFLIRKLQSIAWPLLVWHLINHVRADGTNVWRTVWSPDGISYLWFLEFLLGFCVIAALVRWISPWVLAVLSVPVSVWGPSLGGDEHLYYAVFFFVGIAASPWVFALAERTPPRPGWSWAVLAASLAVSATAYVVGPGPEALKVVRAFAVIALLVIWAMMLPPASTFTRALTWLGRGSLALYVCHWPLGLFLGVALRPFPHAGMFVVAATVAGSLAFVAVRNHRLVRWSQQWPGVSRA